MDQAEFDRFADEYDAMHRANIRASGEGPEYFARYKIEDMVKVWDRKNREQPVQKILDFGGGIGASAPHLSELFPEARITLADVSERSLEIAEARGVERVDTMLFDGASLPIEDASIDTAIAACVFHHIPAEEHIALMAEIRRTLRPGGLFFIFEHNPWNPLTRKAVDTCPFDENAVLITGPELRRRLKAAGFDQVDLSWRIFIPGALRAIRPVENWLEWLPLGAQYRTVAVK
ncbi:class I SAM-dependent methyltransferase [uncultured Shimia sp.]|uniref:class I SAM-dependent methyltransferase n=1 Tax=uncultured Shimia sp. TaxID=573152 RepID=UPI002616CCEA|nr:class I SAM-dependent methyltransferase [uncultured Shimia sp.]